jgi:hypothetical protein
VTNGWSGLLGFLAALGIYAAARVSDTGTGFLVMVSVPLLALGACSVFGAGVAGWWLRVVRGGIAMAVGAGVGLAAVFYLRGRTDWYDWPADSAGHIWIAILAAFAAIPAGAAAAASRPGRGLALAIGFDLGMLGIVFTSEVVLIGMAVLLGLGTLVGFCLAVIARAPESPVS